MRGARTGLLSLALPLVLLHGNAVVGPLAAIGLCVFAAAILVTAAVLADLMR